MTAQQLFILSDNALNVVVQQIKDNQWALEVPEYISPKGGTLREIIAYHAYDDAWVPDTVAGKTIEEVGDKYAGDLLGDDPKAAFAEITAKAVAAVQAMTDPETTLHYTYGSFPASDALNHQTSFRVFRSFTIAKFIGTNTTMSDELVAGVNQKLAPEVEDWRAMGVFGPAIEVPNHASAQDKLLALFGIDPSV
jgi:hypothetical protein